MNFLRPPESRTMSDSISGGKTEVRLIRQLPLRFQAHAAVACEHAETVLTVERHREPRAAVGR
jgi:hypothetical protein